MLRKMMLTVPMLFGLAVTMSSCSDPGQVSRPPVPLARTVPYALDCDFPEELGDLARDGFEFWNDRMSRRVFEELPCVPRGEGIAGVLVVHQDSEGPDGGDFAQAESAVLGGQIVGGRVTFDGLWTALDEDGRRRVARHEVGHVLGFGHVDDRACLMYPYSDDGWGEAALCPAEEDEARKL